MRQQRGQVLVIFAGGLVALMAIAALVVDLGFVFMIHRHEQNAADPGALAAARYIRYPGPAADTTRMFQAACFYARQNGYFRLATDNSKPPSTTGCRAAMTTRVHADGQLPAEPDGRRLCRAPGLRRGRHHREPRQLLRRA